MKEVQHGENALRKNCAFHWVSQRLSLVKHQLLLKVGMMQPHKACVSSEIEEFEKYLKEANS